MISVTQTVLNPQIAITYQARNIYSGKCWRSQTLNNMERNRLDRNRRERKRVRMLRGCFDELKNRLPNNDLVKTKEQILRGATEYISYLELKVKDVREKRARETTDSFQAPGPSCRYAKVHAHYDPTI